MLTPDEVTLAGGKERPAIKITWNWVWSEQRDPGSADLLEDPRGWATWKIADGDFGRCATASQFLVHPALRYGGNYEIAFLRLRDARRARMGRLEGDHDGHRDPAAAGLRSPQAVAMIGSS